VSHENKASRVLALDFSLYAPFFAPWQVLRHSV